MSRPHAARIAPRKPWQAMDLGTRMFRTWWRPLLSIWLLTSLPGLLALLWLTGGNLFWTAMLFWWLKPLWERPLLEYCARALFGEPPTLRALLRSWPDYVRPGLFSALTWRRLSPSRSFNAPVFQLERPRGSAGPRLAVMHAEPGQRAGALTITLVHVEQFISLGILTLLVLLLPLDFSLSLYDWINNDVAHENQLMTLCWYLSMCLTQPLYVCCGFALYLNKRTWLEGWDLEQGLRSIGQRRTARSMAATLPMLWLVLWLGLLLPWLSPGQVHASSEREAVREQAIEIVAGDQLMPMSERGSWRLRRPDRDPNEAREATLLERLLDWLFNRDSGSDRRDLDMDLSVLGDLLRLLLWGLLIATLGWLLWSGRHLVRRDHASTDTRERVSPVDIRARSTRRVTLPDDPVSAIRTALDRGDPREALSLLYRSCLHSLHRRLAVTLPEGATESEVLRQLRQQHAEDREVELLGRITPLWQATAWAHRPVDTDTIAALLNDWCQQQAVPA